MIYVGVDNGYGNTKGDTGFVISSGVKRLSAKPPINSRTLCMGGQYYAIGTPKMEVKKCKTDNEDTLVLTLATIAEKFKRLGVASGEIRLAVGLPLTRMGSEKRDFKEYFMKNRKISFIYEGVSYSVFFISVDVFPQGYAAIVDRLDSIRSQTVVVDIGSWTIDILPIVERQADVSRCKSLALGTLTAMADINEDLRQKFGEEADESIIKHVMIYGSSDINQQYLNLIQDGLHSYVDKIINNLQTLKFNMYLTHFIFMGGGAYIVKNFASNLGENMEIVEDVCINAKAYKDIIERKYGAVNG